MTTIHTAFRTRRSFRGPSLVVKHSIWLRRRKTSVSMEDAFWIELRRFAKADRVRLCDIVGDVAVAQRNPGNLSSAIRLYVLDRLKGEFAEIARTRAPRVPVLREHAEAP